MPEQLCLQFETPRQQTAKFQKIKKQLDQVQTNMKKAEEVFDFSQALMRQAKNNFIQQLQNECNHHVRPQDLHDLVAFFCPACGKPI